MIKRDLTITVKGDESKLSDVVYFYQGDSGIVLSFEIYGLNYDFGSISTDIMAKYKPTSCSILVKKPNGVKFVIDKTTIFNNKIVFKITADMIDDFDEIGTHYFQIRLYDEHDHLLTIPACPIIIKPLINNPAVVDEDKTESGTTGPSDNDQDKTYGNNLPNRIYNIRNWNSGEIIRAYDLNKIETTLDYLVKYEGLTILKDNEIGLNSTWSSKKIEDYINNKEILVTMTRSQYNSLVTKDENVLYVIIDE